MITRTTLPYVTTPNLGPGVGRHDGLGDLVFLGLVLPKLKTEGLTIGIGPTITFPTATSDFTGAGKWQAGPSFLAINTQIPKFQYGIHEVGGSIPPGSTKTANNYIRLLCSTKPPGRVVVIMSA
jgi:hypothetical protein